MEETRPLVPKSKSGNVKASLYRHAWRRAVALSLIYQNKGNKELDKRYQLIALELSSKYDAVAPENLYGTVRLELGGEAFERVIRFELQQLLPDDLKETKSRPLACISIGTCDQGRVYVGQTVGPPELRWAQHRMLSTGPFKDGEKYVAWGVLEREVHPTKLNEREAYYIGYYDAYRSGYNETTGNDWVAYQRGQADRAKISRPSG